MITDNKQQRQQEPNIGQVPQLFNSYSEATNITDEAKRGLGFEEQRDNYTEIWTPKSHYSTAILLITTLGYLVSGGSLGTVAIGTMFGICAIGALLTIPMILTYRREHERKYIVYALATLTNAVALPYFLFYSQSQGILWCFLNSIWYSTNIFAIINAIISIVMKFQTRSRIAIIGDISTVMSLIIINYLLLH